MPGLIFRDVDAQHDFMLPEEWVLERWL